MAYWRTRKDGEHRIVWETYVVDKFGDSDGVESDAVSFANSNPDTQDETKLTADEGKWLAIVNGYVANLRETFDHGIVPVHQKINESAGDADLDSGFRKIGGEFTRECDAALLEFHNDYIVAKEAHTAAKSSFNTFTKFTHKKSKLDHREATYPDSKPLHLSLVVIALIFEAVMSMSFYGEAGGTGLLGGFFVALVVSGTNVGISLLAGYYSLRQLHLADWISRTAGLISFAMAVAVVAAIHLTAAHYREALTTNSDAEVFAALQLLRENPLGLVEFESLLLVAFGVLVSLISMYKGYTLDDKFPGFGAVDRQLKKRYAELRNVEKSLTSAITNAGDKAIRESEDFLDCLRSDLRYLQGLDAEIEAWLGIAENHYETYRQDVIQIVQTFRSTVHAIFEDDGRFPFDEKALCGPSAILPLDPDRKKERLYKFLHDTRDDLQKAIDAFPARCEIFQQSITDKKRKLTGRNEIAKEMKKIDDFTDDEGDAQVVSEEESVDKGEVVLNE